MPIIKNEAAPKGEDPKVVTKAQEQAIRPPFKTPNVGGTYLVDKNGAPVFSHGTDKERTPDEEKGIKAIEKAPAVVAPAAK